MKTRRSAKQIVNQLATSLLKNTKNVSRDAKLDIIQQIASEMDWHDLMQKISKQRTAEWADEKQPWWMK